VVIFGSEQCRMQRTILNTTMVRTTILSSCIPLSISRWHHFHLVYETLNFRISSFVGINNLRFLINSALKIKAYLLRPKSSYFMKSTPSTMAMDFQDREVSYALDQDGKPPETPVKIQYELLQKAGM
jgi:hypothetical protein